MQSILVQLSPIQATTVYSRKCGQAFSGIPEDCLVQWRSEGATDRPGRQSEGVASGISRLLGAAKLYFVPGANNPRYAAGEVILAVHF